MKHEPQNHAGPLKRGPERQVYEENSDVYGQRGKLTDPTVCPKCRATYLEGRWVWKTAPVGSTETICPACRRTEDGYAAGILSVSGAFVHEHRDEIERMLRHVEEREKTNHPLNRIMRIDNEDDGFRVETTQANLARSMGDALRRAYQGDLDLPPPQVEGPMRVRWRRD